MTYPLPAGRKLDNLKQVTLANNQAVQVITVGNKALLCCKHEDLKNVSFKTHGSSYCCIPNCKNFRGKIPNMSFFQFPKDVGRCKTWVSFTTREDVKKKDPSLLYRSGFAICAAHFEDSMFMNAIARNRLIHCAIPTIFDPSRPPPRASIKELAARFSDNVQDNQQFSLAEGDLCIFHRKFLKAITALQTDICDIRYCVICGAPIEEVKEVSPGTYQAICNKRHALLLTTEFASKCQEWVHNCRNLDGIKEVANLENKCHLCEEHFTELSDSAVTVASYNDMSPNLAASELPFPSVEEVTVTTTPAPTGVPHTFGKKTSTKQNRLYPSLPSCFFSVGGYTTCLDKIPEENKPPDQEPAKCLLPHLDLTQKSARECTLSKNLKNCRVKIYRLKKRIVALEEQLKKPPVMSAQMLSRELSKYLKGACLRLVREQLKVSTMTCRRGVRWSEDFLVMANVILQESDKAYNVLKRIMTFPTRSTIRRHLAPSKELPSLADYLKSTFPPGKENDTSEEVPDCGDSEKTELHGKDACCADDYMSEEDAESENENSAINDSEESNLNDELLVGMEDEGETVEQQSVEVQLMSHEDMQIYEMYAQTDVALQNDSGSILLNGEDAAVTIINVVSVKEEN